VWDDGTRAPGAPAVFSSSAGGESRHTVAGRTTKRPSLQALGPPAAFVRPCAPSASSFVTPAWRVRAVVLAARLAHIEQAAMHGVLAQVTMALNLAFVQDESLEHWLQV